jgi:hypothetical protein
MTPRFALTFHHLQNTLVVITATEGRGEKKQKETIENTENEIQKQISLMIPRFALTLHHLQNALVVISVIREKKQKETIENTENEIQKQISLMTPRFALTLHHLQNALVVISVISGPESDPFKQKTQKKPEGIPDSRFPPSPSLRFHTQLSSPFRRQPKKIFWISTSRCHILCHRNMAKHTWPGMHGQACMARHAWVGMHGQACMARHAWVGMHGQACMGRQAWAGMHG